MNKVVVKQDINFLDKPLWFANLRRGDQNFTWGDIDGFEYRSGFRAPDKIDALILYYLLYKSQQSGYKEEVILTRYEILKGCGFLGKNPDFYYKRIEISLECWKNVTLKFDGTFYDKKQYKVLLFGIIDEAKIREEDKLVEVHFNKSWLLKIKESNFFKNLNFEYLKRLKRPISLRLYELLIKNFKDRCECYYKLTNLGVKLTLSGRKNKRGEEVIYASDVLVALIPAINEINKLALTPDIADITGVAQEDIFTITYEIKGKGQSRIIYFYKVPVANKRESKKDNTNDACQEPQETNTQTTEIKDVSPKYMEAMQWLDTIPYFNQKRKTEITNMPTGDIEKIYDGIRKEYERLTKEDKKPKVGWVYKAFVEKWQFSGQLEEKDKEEIKQKIQQKIDIKKAEVKKCIEINGGINRILYKGERIDIIEDHGIYLIEKNALEAWVDVEMESFVKIGK